ncbi:hypothetical protein [Agrococcus jejuensis]|uniref:Uncharacterized protein n=1 Tax=Agrococcus jejuensis TaxID=399736 RepID=A0A1G8EN42_9MICO|nr:hypothetical protein [Agrococcus jejuensis]SDH71323.1 hypothetical protein SAMN04489720_2118 [Agrococcus jejuensis]
MLRRIAPETDGSARKAKPGEIVLAMSRGDLVVLARAMRVLGRAVREHEVESVLGVPQAEVERLRSTLHALADGDADTVTLAPGEELLVAAPDELRALAAVLLHVSYPVDSRDCHSVLGFFPHDVDAVDRALVAVVRVGPMRTLPAVPKIASASPARDEAPTASSGRGLGERIRSWLRR